MARYPQLERPLPPGKLTLREYAPKVGRSARYIGDHWRSRPGFPTPAGELRARGRRGGGRGELVYEETALDAFRASQPDLWGQRTDTIAVTGRSLDERVTLGDFANHIAHEDCETVARHADQDGFPPAGTDGLYRLGDLISYWNTRPLLVTDRDHDDRMTLSAFADEVVEKSRKTVTQYRDQLPPPGADGRYRLGDLIGFWNTGRPGKRGPAAKSEAA